MMVLKSTNQFDNELISCFTDVIFVTLDYSDSDLSLKSLKVNVN